MREQPVWTKGASAPVRRGLGRWVRDSSRGIHERAKETPGCSCLRRVVMCGAAAAIHLAALQSLRKGMLGLQHSFGC